MNCIANPTRPLAPNPIALLVPGVPWEPGAPPGRVSTPRRPIQAPTPPQGFVGAPGFPGIGPRTIHSHMGPEVAGFPPDPRAVWGLGC